MAIGLRSGDYVEDPSELKEDFELTTASWWTATAEQTLSRSTWRPCSGRYGRRLRCRTPLWFTKRGLREVDEMIADPKVKKDRRHWLINHWRPWLEERPLSLSPRPSRAPAASRPA